MKNPTHKIKTLFSASVFLALFPLFTSCDGDSSSSAPAVQLTVVEMNFSPATSPGGSRVESVWNEVGFRIESGHMGSYSSTSVATPPGFRASNGTDHLSFTSGAFGTGATRITNIQGDEFSAISVDLAEYSHVFPVPKDITFIGTKGDGSQVSITFTTDGVITGPGADNDFERFGFPATFNSLKLLEVPTGVFAMDNVILATAP